MRKQGQRCEMRKPRSQVGQRRPDPSSDQADDRPEGQCDEDLLPDCARMRETTGGHDRNLHKTHQDKDDRDGDGKDPDPSCAQAVLPSLAWSLVRGRFYPSHEHKLSENSRIDCCVRLTGTLGRACEKGPHGRIGRCDPPLRLA